MDYVHPSAVASVDSTDDYVARDCRWYRPDELLTHAEHARLQGRLLTPQRAKQSRSASSASSFDRAVRKVRDGGRTVRPGRSAGPLGL